MESILLFIPLLCIQCPLFRFEKVTNSDLFKIGVGIGDITGPVADVTMMGYAKLGQVTAGIHIRQYSRAFVIEDFNKNRICYVSADICMVDQLVKTEVTKILMKKFPGFYDETNVMISGTHTHSGPGGFLQYFLYSIPTGGFVRQCFDAIVNGIVRSIELAHNSMSDGHIYFNRGTLRDSNINPSPTAYLKNPSEERDKYESDTDQVMYLLKFTDLSGNPIGTINWFAVHCTSMNNTNQLISGDNKGYASQLFEKHLNPNSLPGKVQVIAAFASANLGDVSPNTKGPHCIDTGESCDILHSTCGGNSEKCIASGPGDDMFQSTEIIGRKQYMAAKELFDNANDKITGTIKFAHQNVDMTDVQLELDDGTIVHTCKPALGFSFAAGTTDGPGSFLFQQGTKEPVLLQKFGYLLNTSSLSHIDCHKPKPILIPTGLLNIPYEWHPSILPTQVFKIGDVYIAGVPGEFTTMSGRRLRRVIGEISGSHNIILSGLTNAYSSYVTTLEEYQEQRYEAASTIYGPYTLNAYLKQYKRLVESVMGNRSMEPGPVPPNLLDKQISLQLPNLIDNSFGLGRCLTDLMKCYTPGSTVSVDFISGHPNNNLMTEKTYLTVDRFSDDRSIWTIVATDANWETKFKWKRAFLPLQRSYVTIEWNIPLDVSTGTYRISHYGYYKSLSSTKPYYGRTNTFQVLTSCNGK